MNIGSPGETYSKQNEAATRAEIDREDKRNQKIGADIVSNGDATVKGPRLIIVSPNGTRYRVLVSNAGALSTTPV